MPLYGDVVLIGRQSVYFTSQEIVSFLRDYGLDVGDVNPRNIEIDRRTLHRPPEFANRDLITDAALFRLLGVPKVRALDLSDYEGAEITTSRLPSRRHCGTAPTSS